MIIPVAHNLTNSSGILTWIFPRKGGGGGRGSSSSSGKSSSSGSSSSAGGSSRGSFNVASSGTGTFSASSSSRGGGSPKLVAGGSQFAGRLSGGATRDQVYGDSRVGSGYPYGGYGTFYGGRPFPYAFYPIYIAPGYYGGDEYGPTMNDTRPGGLLSTAIVLSNNASQDSYYLVGDESSVSTVLASLVSQCGIANSTVTNTYINGTTSLNGTALVPRPEQMVQYYRASSFALALSTYNNSAALPSRAPASNGSAPPPLSEDTPLPSGINTTLLTCLNSTIAATVPLLDNDSGKHGLTGGDIYNIIMASLFGSIMLVALLSCCGSCRSLGPRSKPPGR